VPGLAFGHLPVHGIERIRNEAEATVRLLPSVPAARGCPAASWPHNASGLGVRAAIRPSDRSSGHRGMKRLSRIAGALRYPTEWLSSPFIPEHGTSFKEQRVVVLTPRASAAHAAGHQATRPSAPRFHNGIGEQIFSLLWQIMARVVAGRAREDAAALVSRKPFFFNGQRLPVPSRPQYGKE
jgi:hypothetical protein